MNTLKSEFVSNELTMLLKTLDNTIRSCTYYEDGDEIVVVQFNDGSCELKVCVTGDSLAQLTIDVIKKSIM